MDQTHMDKNLSEACRTAISRIMADNGFHAVIRHIPPVGMPVSPRAAALAVELRRIAAVDGDVRSRLCAPDDQRSIGVRCDIALSLLRWCWSTAHSMVERGGRPVMGAVGPDALWSAMARPIACGRHDPARRHRQAVIQTWDRIASLSVVDDAGLIGTMVANLFGRMGPMRISPADILAALVERQADLDDQDAGATKAWLSRIQVARISSHRSVA